VKSLRSKKEAIIHESEKKDYIKEVLANVNAPTVEIEDIVSKIFD
jgi:hypothetical protein